MNNFVKATVRKLAELPWPDLRDLFSWSANGSTIQAENSNLLVARASNGSGETIAYVCAENILLVDSYVFSPNVTLNEAAKAGDVIDSALAQHASVSRMLIVIPPEAPPIGGEKRIRVVERKVYQCTVPQPGFEIKQQIAFLN